MDASVVGLLDRAFLANGRHGHAESGQDSPLRVVARASIELERVQLLQRPRHVDEVRLVSVVEQAVEHLARRRARGPQHVDDDQSVLRASASGVPREPRRVR